MRSAFSADHHVVPMRKAGELPSDPEELLQSFEARVAAQTQRALTLSAALEAAEVTARSEGGEVTVTVNSAGGLADLEFHAESDKLSRPELARLVLSTSHRAQAKLASRVAELTANLYGSDSGTGALITDAYRNRYPQSEEEH
ncbi:YbaB/EbfC family nucleoid-associated protein [Actinoplanes sp. NPDC051411]|uniref:YbaB/EbfC family nucleoid-associated protein n=1 Tax=Actinoplanes sp. NPDC051411 TaxID=3155522 RepID=UPI003444CCFA